MMLNFTSVKFSKKQGNLVGQYTVRKQQIQVRDVFGYFKDVVSKYLNIFNKWTLELPINSLIRHISPADGTLYIILVSDVLWLFL